MYKKTLLTLAMASSLALTGCENSGGGNAGDRTDKDGVADP